jgi:hypothetical protein
MSTRNRKNVVERDRRIKLTTLPSSVNRLSGQCGILNISQTYRPQRPVKRKVLLYFFSLTYISKDRLCGLVVRGHPASYAMGTGGSFSESKTAEA